MDQKMLDDLVLDFVVGGIHSLNVVTEPGFRKMIGALVQNSKSENMKVLSRRTLTKNLFEKAERYK